MPHRRSPPMSPMHPEHLMQLTEQKIGLAVAGANPARPRSKHHKRCGTRRTGGAGHTLGAPHCASRARYLFATKITLPSLGVPRAVVGLCVWRPSRPAPPGTCVHIFNLQQRFTDQPSAHHRVARYALYLTHHSRSAINSRAAMNASAVALPTVLAAGGLFLVLLSVVIVMLRSRTRAAARQPGPLLASCTHFTTMVEVAARAVGWRAGHPRAVRRPCACCCLHRRYGERR